MQRELLRKIHHLMSKVQHIVKEFEYEKIPEREKELEREYDEAIDN